jgi:hypothetical protein
MKLVTAKDAYRAGKHDRRRSHHEVGTERFVAIDGEGMTIPDGSHGYVLLGIGQDQIENEAGLDWLEILPFIYAHYTPKTAYVGYYLGYDFTQWIKTLPEDRARRLLTIEGKESRRSTSPKLRGRFLPVSVDDWEIDLLGSKRFQFRYRPCRCETMKCEHNAGPWLYVCDAGPFFQTSFLNTIDPKQWQEPIVSAEVFETISAGKERRSEAVLDDEMRFYNRLENETLEKVMHDLNEGFRRLDVALSPKQWFGPGQAAQAWMRGRAHTTEEIRQSVPEWFLEAARESYFGGWFEQQAHGIIPGVSYENDINNAYPHIISTLPCLLHGTYSQGEGKTPPANPGDITLVRALAYTTPPHSANLRGHSLGAMLHRDKQGRIARPLITAGWYWQHELDTAKRAKAVRKYEVYEWMRYSPCGCQPPLWQVVNLYRMRLDVGKKSSLGKAAKLTNNSIYGKTAQSVGVPEFSNPIYASLITAGCRAMILDAIATHPMGKRAVLMVATDAVYFLEPHPTLNYGPGLGQWETKTKENLTLFKPGVYWDDEARERIRVGDHPNFKARGVSAKDFAGTIESVDRKFMEWGAKPPAISDTRFTPEELEAMGEPTWPKVKFTSRFAMTTALQALVRNDWETAGRVTSEKELVQNANPEDKRRDIWLDESIPGRPLYRSEPLEVGRNAIYRHAGNIGGWDSITEESYWSVPYEKRFGLEDPFSEESLTTFGVSPDEIQPLRGAFRVLTGQED